MRLTKITALWCCWVGLPIACALAQDQVAHLGEIHVSPPDSKAGVLLSLKPSGSKISSSPEAVKMMGDLIKANGLETLPATSWHIELTYDEFDEDGDNAHSGTLEEFYVNPKQYRKVIKTDEFSQTEVASGGDLYRSGDQNWPPAATSQAVWEVVSPLYQYQVSALDDTSPDKLDWTVGGVKLSCIVLRNRTVLSESGLQKFCFEPGTTILRYSRGTGWDETVYNGVFRLGERYLARDVEVTHGGKPFLKIHLVKVEAAPQLEESLFLPPTDTSGPLTGVVSVPSAILMKEYLMHRELPPHVPRGIHGKVTVKFTVNKEGRVVRAQATDGPAELRKPVEENVMKWQFRPFLILDKPVEVESTTFYNIQ
jgi:hypothetical protein